MAARTVVAALALAAGTGLAKKHVKEARNAQSIADQAGRTPGHGGQLISGDGVPIRVGLFGDSVVSSVETGSVAEQLSVTIASQGFRVTVDDYAYDGHRAEHLTQQIARLGPSRPNLAVICVGGNDVTHLWPRWTFRTELRRAIGDLRRPAPDLPIILIGCPRMSTIPSLGWWLRHEFGLRGRNLNRITARVAREQDVTFAHLAWSSGDCFRDYPEIVFSDDLFHPNEIGNTAITNDLFRFFEPWLDVRKQRLAT